MTQPKAPWAAPTIYHDGASLFLEWPAAPGRSPYAQRFTLSEGGLAKALRLVPNIASAPGYISGASNLAARALKPKVAKATAAKRVAATFTDEQRSAASAVLRKLKVGG